LGGGNEKGENDVFPSPSKGHQTLDLPLATKQNVPPLAIKFGTFQGPPNIRTFHQPPSWGFLSPSSFCFSLKVQIWII
jgi:hypothetical protein